MKMTQSSICKDLNQVKNITIRKMVATLAGKLGKRPMILLVLIATSVVFLAAPTASVRRPVSFTIQINYNSPREVVKKQMKKNRKIPHREVKSANCVIVDSI